MKDSRKQIIVNELLNWKKSRMLPDQYCDYLLALYTEGNQPKEKKIGMMVNIINLIFLLLIPISVFLIYFTELSIILQTAFLSLFVFAGILAVFYFSRKRISFHLPIISTAFILLIGSVALASGLSGESHFILYFALFLNCLLWLVSGWKLSLPYFWISGTFGFLLTVISIFI
ncbi:hypothetical protein J7I93_20040 [Bacillus sp. ISL-47]|nr:hypothetical protein [Bacillus sp. ISL-47]